MSDRKIFRKKKDSRKNSYNQKGCSDIASESISDLGIDSKVCNASPSSAAGARGLHGRVDETLSSSHAMEVILLGLHAGQEAILHKATRTGWGLIRAEGRQGLAGNHQRHTPLTLEGLLAEETIDLTLVDASSLGENLSSKTIEYLLVISSLQEGKYETVLHEAAGGGKIQWVRFARTKTQHRLIKIFYCLTQVAQYVAPQTL